ncbi:MAG: hypothetical protein WC503_02365 [Candidatus Shapirobacteria bacterium]|nr:hypothetical protein [Candidatus Methanoperedens sp.]
MRRLWIFILFVFLLSWSTQIFQAFRYTFDRYNPKVKKLSYIKQYNYYKVGDEIVLAEDCGFEVKGKIILITDKGIYIHGVSKPFLNLYSLPHLFKYVTNNTYFGNYNSPKCTDGIVFGLRIKISTQLDKNNQLYLQIDDEIEGYSTMPH